MHRTRHLVLPLALAVAAPAASAQSRFHNAWDDLKHMPGDMLGVWISPINIRSNDLIPLGATAAVWGTALWKDQQIQHWVDTHPRVALVRAAEPFKSQETLGNLGEVWMSIRYSSALWLVGVAVNSKTLRDAGSGCASAGMAQTFERHGFYELVRRTRPEFTTDPYTFDVPGTKNWNKRAFPGGHGANAITCIAFWNGRFHMSAVEPVLYAAAVGVGFSRTVERAHWMSDTIFGLAFGYAAGHVVANRMNHRNEKDRLKADSGSTKTDSSRTQFHASTDGSNVRVWWTLSR